MSITTSSLLYVGAHVIPHLCSHIQNSAFAVKNDTLSRYIKGESLGSSSDNKQTKGKEKSIQSTGKRVLLVHVSRVEKNALMELLLDPEVQRHLKDTKAVGT